MSLPPHKLDKYAITIWTDMFLSIWNNSNGVSRWCVQFCGTDGHAVCCCPDDVCSVERSIHKSSHETLSELQAKDQQRFHAVTRGLFCDSGGVSLIKRLWNIYLVFFFFATLQGFSAMSRIQTDANLPPLKKLAPPDSKSKERLFVVFSPNTLPTDVLEDVFW